MLCDFYNNDENLNINGRIDISVIDIHSHMMFDMDDGAVDFSMTKEMIKMSYLEGCSHVFLTPHASSIKRKKMYTKRYEEIERWILLEGPDISVHSGCEIRIENMASDNIKKIVKKIKRGIYPALNNTNYVLIEFSPTGFRFEEIVDAVSNIVNAGYIPIIAHAEKYGADYGDLIKLRNMGCKLQINLSDVFSEHSYKMIEMTNWLLKEKMVDYVGTDAHRSDRRKPEIRLYANYLYSNYEAEYIDDILFNNAYANILMNDI